MESLTQKLFDIKYALKQKSISVNEYCSMYYEISQQIKQLKNAD
jgi:hypothetical protein